MMSKTILLIDDEPTILKVLENRLKANGYNVITALSGEKGIAKAKKEKPDLIILDVLMPVVFGGEAAQQLQKDPQTAAIPIIFLSNVPSEFLSGQERLAGEAQQEVEGRIYLSKLCSPEELLEAINSTLSQ